VWNTLKDELLDRCLLHNAISLMTPHFTDNIQLSVLVELKFFSDRWDLSFKDRGISDWIVEHARQTQEFR